MGDSQMASVATFYKSAWIDAQALDQLHHVAQWAGVSHVAAFPDLHPGRYGPVGVAVLADRLYPQLIGPDIGCGMTVFKLDLTRRKFKADKAARRMRALQDPMDQDAAQEALRLAGLSEDLHFGLGSVGLGNHFCEVQCVQDIFDPEKAALLGLEKNQVCLLVHTGSRNMGARIFAGLDTFANGFALGSDQAQDYVDLHDTAVAWARLNRLLVAQRAAQALRADLEMVCDTSHNHLSLTKEGVVHRKGVAEPDGGLAPLAGSRETLSYLLSVKALSEALGCVSHGAGRRYDRSSMHGRIPKARSALAALEKNKFGGVVMCEDKDLMIEEAGHAYKSSVCVVEDLQNFDVAHPVLSLAPLLTFKVCREER